MFNKFNQNTLRIMMTSVWKPQPLPLEKYKTPLILLLCFTNYWASCEKHAFTTFLVNMWDGNVRINSKWGSVSITPSLYTHIKSHFSIVNRTTLGFCQQKK